MVIYEVTATVEPELTRRYARYMIERHVPDVLATKCFEGAVFSRSGLGRYRVRYDARNREAVDRYVREHAHRLRQDLTTHLPTGVELTCEVWTVIERWWGDA
jgi:hypothetical protein